MLMTDIHIRSFTGSQLKPYLHGLMKIRTEVFREYPYFEEPDLQRELQHLSKIISCKETIGVLIFDHTTLVGVSFGYPLSLEAEEILQPFHDLKIDIDKYFFFGDSALLKKYRGRGIGHHFFDAREAHVQHYQKYEHICFYFLDKIEEIPSKPADYIPLFDFWRKRGYNHHPEITNKVHWKETGSLIPIERQVSFWIKNI